MKLIIGFAGIAGVVYLPIAGYGVRESPVLLFALLFLWALCLSITEWSFRQSPSARRVLSARQRRQDRER